MSTDTIINAFSGPDLAIFGKAPNFTLPVLPYVDTALEPVISARILGFHYGKHHQAYVDNLNDLTH
jgi:Fe-Mn family superoxide dismutase